MTTDLRYRLFALLIGLGLALQAPAAMAASEAQELVDKARLTTEKMFNHPDTKSLRGWVKKAKGVLIIPSLLKAGFVFGGEGGRGDGAEDQRHQHNDGNPPRTPNRQVLHWQPVSQAIPPSNRTIEGLGQIQNRRWGYAPDPKG